MTFSIGDVISRTFSVFSKNAPGFLALSAILVGIPTLLSSYWQESAGFSSMSVIIGIVASIVSIGTGYILQGAVVNGAIKTLNGQTTSVSENLSIGLSNFLPLLGIGILAGIGVGIGFMLLIIPGIILAIFWSVIVPARVVENKGIMESFERSRELTKGYRWHILGLVVVVVVISVVLMFLFGLLASPFVTTNDFGMTTSGAFPIALATSIATVISSVISAVGVTSLYYELRKLKEGIGTEELASVFS